MQLLSIEDWAKRENVKPRQAYRWAKSKRLTTKKRTVVTRGVPADITLADVKEKAPRNV